MTAPTQDATAQHTPGLYQVDLWTYTAPDREVLMIQTDADAIAEVKLLYRPNATTAEAALEEEANASFIVLACNAHDELVAALRALVDHADEQYPHFESPRGQRDIEAARAALTKATP